MTNLKKKIFIIKDKKKNLYWMWVMRPRLPCRKTNTKKQQSKISNHKKNLKSK